MYYYFNNFNNVNELTLGDRIGEGGMIFLRRNFKKEAEMLREKGYTTTLVDVLCPFCGKIKTLHLGNLKNGNIKGCECVKRNYARVLNFGWVYDSEAGVDVYGNRIINVHSVWVPEDKAVFPEKELNSSTNRSGFMMCSRWAKTHVEFNNIDLNQLLAEYDRRIDDKAEIKADSPNKNKIIPTEAEGQFATDKSHGADEVLIKDLLMKAPETAKAVNPHKREIISTEVGGNLVSVQAHGLDEFWIKSLLMKDPENAKAAKDTVYIAGDELIGKTADHIGDCLAKYADFRTVIECDGHKVDVYEEFDSSNHRIDHPSQRDVNVELGCAAHNKGLFRISTRLPAIKERDAETFMAIRQFALDRIRANIVHNFQVGYNERPTVMRVTIGREIEEGMPCEGKMLWTQVAKVSDFKAARC